MFDKTELYVLKVDTEGDYDGLEWTARLYREGHEFIGVARWEQQAIRRAHRAYRRWRKCGRGFVR